MKLRKLLLSSAAAAMVVGGAGTAKAADVMNGMMVAAGTALYSCNDGNGIQFTTWCVIFSGSSTFTSKYGWQFSYGTDPSTLVVQDVNGTAPPAFPWTGFTLTNTLALTATRDTANGKTITIKTPIVGTGTTSLTLARPGGNSWTFTSTSVTLVVPASFATFTFVVAEGPLHPFWPDVSVKAVMTAGNFTVTAFAQAGWANFGGGAAFAPEFDLDVTGTLGAVTLAAGFHFDRVATTTSPPGVNAFGFTGSLSATMGMITATLAGSYAINSQQWTSGYYHYTSTVTGARYWHLAATLAAAWNAMHSSSITFYYADATGAFANDQQYGIDLSHTIVPSDGAYSITLNGWWARAYDNFGAGFNVWGAGLTLAVSFL